ncbi:energy transducer TonB [Sapientia aquatica]|uniref:Energy transducer TonB n=1 Tax=Sapientia aquatica TaxID=1549640 RepID=A0A4R5VWI5_9BURK|nr:energy transducer TonB [Sapientia aquatica]TDK62584.1 energy transducer TonB [Sapientia aquatica]
MKFALDIQPQHRSMTSLIVVGAMHIALFAALIYGLKTTSIDVIRQEDVIVFPPKPLPDPPQVEHDPVKLKDPVTPTIIPPDLPPVEVDPNRVITLPPQPPHTSGGNEIGGKEGGVGIDVPAAVFVGAVVEAKSCDKPEYPRNSLRNGDTGVVTLGLLIGVDGKVSESRIEQTSGHKELDRAALAGLSLCKFKPATLDGKAQKSWAKLQYAWNLAD